MNYRIDPKYGVLTQLNRESFTYDDAYNSIYDTAQYREGERRLCTIRFNKIMEYMDWSNVGQFFSILDIGCGNGAFVNYANSIASVKAHGFDVAVARPSYDWYVSDISEGAYDVITFFDSLEHVTDIGSVLARLAPHKYVVISCPCLREDFSTEWFMQWKHRKENEHLWHFSPSSLRYFMESQGYEMLYMGNPEDEVRKGTEPGRWNIITAIFKLKEQS